MPSLSVHSPLGPLTISEHDGSIVALGWGWSRTSEETGLLGLARDQLDAYFHGEREDFRLPLAPTGSAFQRAVWSRMIAIPYGGTESYGEVAEAVGSAPRAVGSACASNPIPILIPCHRVVGKDGALTGYTGADGVGSKRYLLQLEGGLTA